MVCEQFVARTPSRAGPGVFPALAGQNPTMELLDAHARAMEEFNDRVHLVRPDQWGNATPCTDWDVRALVSHLVSEQLWAPHILAGRTVEAAGNAFDGDQLGDDPISAWDRAAARAAEAFGLPGALDGSVHLSYGEDAAVTYAQQMTTDLAIHAWDLARGIGADDGIDEELLRTVHDWMAPQADQLAASGLFAAPVPASGDASTQTKILGLFGRDASRT